MVEQPRPGSGCGVGLLLLLLGVVAGVGLTLTLFGLGFQDVAARLTGQPVAVRPAGAGGESVTISRTSVTVSQTVVQTTVSVTGGAPPGPTPAPASDERVFDGYLVAPPVPVTDVDTALPDMLVMARRYGGGDTLVYLSLDRGVARWESPVTIEYDDPVAYGPGGVYVAAGSQIVALSRESGQPLWEAPISDIVEPYCVGCLQVIGGSVVALTSDGVVQAVAAADGQALWSRRLIETPRQLLNLGGRVGVSDRDGEGSSATALLVLDPASGEEQDRIVPTCESSMGDEFASIYSPVFLDAEGQTLSWVLPGSETCVVRHGLDGERLWTATIDEAGLFLDDPSRIVLADGGLYLGNDGRIIEVREGQGRVVIENEDYELRPLDTRDGLLLLEAVRQRGSTRVELWLVDAASGEARWERVVNGDDVVTATEQWGNWAARLTGDGVALIEINEETDIMSYRLLALADGAEGAAGALDGSGWGPSLQGVVWDRGYAWLSFDKLVIINLAQGSITARWP